MKNAEAPWGMTVLAHPSGVGPIGFMDESTTIRASVVSQKDVKLLPRECRVAGVYLLLYPVEGDGSRLVYVGKASSDVRSRVMTHAASKKGWERAVVLFRKHEPFSSALVDRLERELYDMMEATPNVKLDNMQCPQGGELPARTVRLKREAVRVLRQVLQVVDVHPPASGATSGSKKPKASKPPKKRVNATRTRRRFTVTVAELVDAGLLKAGAELVSIDPVISATARVDSDGGIEVHNRSYSSPSAAAMVFTQGNVNGWLFWGVAGESGSGATPLAFLRTKLMTVAPV